MPADAVTVILLDSSAPTGILQSARALFLEYGEFLRAHGEHDGFSFERLQREAIDLPTSYSKANGAVFVAVAGEEAVGCVAFRELAEMAADCCEIKRLFVRPDHRGCGLGLQLVGIALDEARARGYRSACLDTEPVMMAAAHRTYLKVGFVEYGKRGGVSLLRKSLV